MHPRAAKPGDLPPTVFARRVVIHPALLPAKSPHDYKAMPELFSSGGVGISILLHAQFRQEDGSFAGMELIKVPTT